MRAQKFASGRKEAKGTPTETSYRAAEKARHLSTSAHLSPHLESFQNRASAQTERRKHKKMTAKKGKTKEPNHGEEEQEEDNNKAQEEKETMPAGKSPRDFNRLHESWECVFRTQRGPLRNGSQVSNQRCRLCCCCRFVRLCLLLCDGAPLTKR
jgi:hypothetical protein